MNILPWSTKTDLTLEVLALKGNCLEKPSERTLGKESDTFQLHFDPRICSLVALVEFPVLTEEKRDVSSRKIAVKSGV